MSSTRILLWSIFTAYSESFLWIDVTLCIKIIHILFSKVKTHSRVSSVHISPWKHKNTCHELGATPLRCVSLIKPFSRDNREFQWTKLKVSWCIQTGPLLLAHKLFTELKNVGWLLSYESFMIAFYFFSVTGFFSILVHFFVRLLPVWHLAHILQMRLEKIPFEWILWFCKWFYPIFKIAFYINFLHPELYTEWPCTIVHVYV